MSTYPQDQRLAHYEKLPDVLKQALYSAELADHIFEIGKKYGLTIEKIGFLAEESGFVVLGLTHPNEFINTLKNRLEVTDDRARDIALDISHQVFFPLREALKNTHNIEIKEEALQESAPTAPRMPIPAPPSTPLPAPRPMTPPPTSVPPQPTVETHTPAAILQPIPRKPLLPPESPKPPSPPISPKPTPEPPKNIPLVNIDVPSVPPAPQPAPPPPAAPKPETILPPIKPPPVKTAPSDGHDLYREPAE